MTAVEWLAEKYNEVNWLRNRDEISSKYADELREVFFYQAKEMEKEQLECAWNSSDQNMRFQFSSSAYKAITFKQWLENFKEEKL
jgi:ribosome biogenesis protein Nip4